MAEPQETTYDNLTPHEAAILFFNANGWTPAQAAGIVANLHHESDGFKLNALGDGGASYGLGQWQKDRRKNLFDYAATKQEKVPSLGTQLEFVQMELDSDPKYGAAELRQAKTAEEATQIFSNKFERPSKPMMGNRLRLAKEIMGQLFGPSEAQAATIPPITQKQAPIPSVGQEKPTDLPLSSEAGPIQPAPQTPVAEQPKSEPSVLGNLLGPSEASAAEIPAPEQPAPATTDTTQTKTKAQRAADAYRMGLMGPKTKARYEDAIRLGIVKDTLIEQPAPPQTPPAPEPLDLSGMQGVTDVSQSKDFPKVARPVLEYGGALVGGPAGYAVGSMVANAMDERVGNRPLDLTAEGKPPGIPKYQDEPIDYSGMQGSTDVSQSAAGKEFAKDLAIGGVMKGAEKVIPAVGEKVADTAKSLAAKLYESAIKIPPSVPSHIRNRMVKTGIEGEYLPTTKGLEKLHTHIGELNQKIAKTIQNAADSGSVVEREKVLSRIDDLKEFYQNAPNKSEYLDQLEGVKEMMRENWGEKIPADVAQLMKQTIYRIHRKHYGEMKTLQIEADKSIARGIKEELAEQFPALQTLNSKDSALINLEEGLERAVNRIRNYDIVKMGDTIIGAGGLAASGPTGALAAALTKHVIEAPGMKSRLAFALNRAASRKIPEKPVAYGVAKATDSATDRND